MAQLIDLTGKRFGRLIVKEKAPTTRKSNGSAYWKCKCDCGNNTESNSQQLRRGLIVSCGCSIKERLRKGLYYKHGQSTTPKWNLWFWAKRRAKKKGLAFTITLSDIPEIPKECPILGIPLTTGHSKKTLPTSVSLDRIVPSKGYVVGNIQVISHKANTIKNDATTEELYKIYLYMSKIESSSYNARTITT